MKVSQSIKLAGIFGAVFVGYFLLRGMTTTTQDEASSTVEAERFTVLAKTIEPKSWRAEISVSGRTKAERKVIVRAQTPGVIADTPATLGAMLSEGDTICRIATDARAAQLAEARAGLAKARLDYDAAVKLNKEGFRSNTGVASAKAALDLAAANTKRAALEIEKTNITAPFDGVYNERFVEKGDYVGIGDPCGMIIQRSPFLVTGAISERDVAKISKGDRGVAHLATGETIDGIIRFVAAAADPATRTFDVELQIPNEDGALRDGVTAEFTVFASERAAHRIPRNSITQNETDDLGVKTLDENNTVIFNRVQLLGEDAQGVWISGLSGAVKLITRGQDYVKVGQVVSIDQAATTTSGANQ